MEGSGVDAEQLAAHQMELLEAQQVLERVPTHVSDGVKGQVKVHKVYEMVQRGIGDDTEVAVADSQEGEIQAKEAVSL